MSWCWPVAVLSYFIGPLGAAFWFLYRKMYKIAAIFIAIGLAVSVATSVINSVTYNSDTVKSIETLMEEYFTSPPETAEELTAFLQEYITAARSSLPLGTVISQAASLACMVITGIYGFYWYKNFAVKRIAEYRRRNADMRYYQFGLVSLGGTSTGAVIIGALIAFISNAIINNIF